MKNHIVTTISNGKKTLQNLEDELLRLLYESKGSLLENKELFDTLQTSKVTSQAVKESLEVCFGFFFFFFFLNRILIHFPLQMAEVTEVEIDTARSGYLPCASRASILFFVLNDMGSIDPMYQFSLDSYLSLFSLSIDKSPKSPVLEDRITHLNDYHTYSVYRNTCRGLFEMHKLLFSFHMCIKILDAMGKVKNFLLRSLPSEIFCVIFRFASGESQRIQLFLERRSRAGQGRPTGESLPSVAHGRRLG